MDAKNVFTCSQPFLTFVKIFGLFPLTLNRNQTWKTTILDFINTLIAISIFFGFGSLCFMDVFSYEIGSNILEKAWSLTYKLGIFLQLMLICYQLWKRKKLASVLTTLHIVDAKVSKMKIKNENNI